MILYHGTNAEFGEIDLCKSKPNKDFGQGFYLSREYPQEHGDWSVSGSWGSRERILDRWPRILL